jgi:hypothetical protein
VGIRRILFSLTFATALLALASSGASAFVYSSFVCQAVGVRSVDWGRSFFVGDAKMIALGRCARVVAPERPDTVTSFRELR